MTLTHTHGEAEASHTHAHDESGTHVHAPGVVGPEVPISEGASSASVALDIGSGLGALLILPSERFRGAEIEISSLDGDDPRTHTGVHERSTQSGRTLTAIFGSLKAGRYLIWEDATTAGPEVEVPDGAVATVRLD